jgi:hypothetical protein
MSQDLHKTLEIDPAIRAVEVKITAQVNDEDLVRAALERSGEEPQHRRVYFFDTPELDLFEGGVVLRARAIEGDTNDSTVKLRPVDPTALDEAWKRKKDFEIELDSVGDNTICSAKLSADQRRDEIDEVAAGTRPLRKLFSEEQERLITEHAPRAIAWDELSVLGPIEVRKWKIDPEDFKDEIVAEEWTLPDGSDLIELSIKVDPARARQAGKDFMAFLEARGFDTEGDQQTKTRAALQFFTTGVGFT